jgi:hypothetical protein
LPWYWRQCLPGLAQVLPDRFSILADGAAAAGLAFSLARARPSAMLLGRPAITAGQVLAWRLYPVQRARVSSSSARPKAG